MSGQNWGSWPAWTPTLTGSTTDPSLGTGATQRGGVIQVGTIVHWWAQITFGTSPSVGSGIYQLELPITPIARDVPLGFGAAIDVSESGTVYPLTVALVSALSSYLSTSRLDAFMMSTAAAGTSASISCGAAVPFTWAAGDIINVAGSYEAATF